MEARAPKARKVANGVLVARDAGPVDDDAIKKKKRKTKNKQKAAEAMAAAPAPVSAPAAVPAFAALPIVVHRCRFAGWMPSAVVALAAYEPPVAAGGVAASRLAVARADGSIEIVVPRERWAVERRVAGRADTPVSGLLWLARPAAPTSVAASDDAASSQAVASASAPPPPRLFGASLNGAVFEVDLASCALHAVADALGGAVWSLAADAARGRLAAACDDGTVRLFRVVDATNGGAVAAAIEYERTLAVVGDGGRVLSLAWYCGDALAAAQNGGAGDVGGEAAAAAVTTLWCGCDDGVVRRVSLRASDACTAGLTTRLTLEAAAPARVAKRAKGGPRGGGCDAREAAAQLAAAEAAKARVWCVRCSADGSFLFSGDSRGRVCVWDARLGVLLASFARHDADVLTLALAPGERALYAAGVDSKICRFEVRRTLRSLSW